MNTNSALQTEHSSASPIGEGNYFIFLLQYAAKHRLLTQRELERIQLSCIEMLGEAAAKYAQGDCSIRIEAAESLLTSLLYTIGLSLKAYSNPQTAISALMTTPLGLLYRDGRKRIDHKLMTAKYLHRAILGNWLKTANVTYNETLHKGIKGFFKCYHPDYSAHDIHITADYPTCRPILNTLGIEFIVKYLESIYLENMFCAYFSLELICQRLKSYHSDYSELVFNIFEFIFTAAIGCTLANTNAASLTLSEPQIFRIELELSGKPHNELCARLETACDQLIDRFGIAHRPLKRYLKASLPAAATNISAALETHSLDIALMQQAPVERQSTISMVMRQLIASEPYRRLISEINACRYSSDKLALVDRHIKGLAYLEAVLLDVDWTFTEMLRLLKRLDSLELSALVKRHAAAPLPIELTEQESTLRAVLAHYVDALPQKARQKIDDTAARLLLKDE